MPLPLAPLIPFALRLGAVAAVTYAARRWLTRRTFPGRIDQRAEDALDDLGEGLSSHRPADRDQRNTTARLRRRVRFRGRTWDLDAGLFARVRLHEVKE